MHTKVQYCVHKRPPVVPILNQIEPVHTMIFSSSKMCFNIILQPTSRSSQWLSPSGLPAKTLHAFLFRQTRTIYPIHSTLNLIIPISVLKCTSYTAPHYAVSSTLLLFHSSGVKSCSLSNHVHVTLSHADKTIPVSLFEMGSSTWKKGKLNRSKLYISIQCLLVLLSKNLIESFPRS
jgi:hypothetical protein